MQLYTKFVNYWYIPPENNRKEWDSQDMLKAVEAKQASKVFEVPKSTVERYAKLDKEE